MTRTFLVDCYCAGPPPKIRLVASRAGNAARTRLFVLAAVVSALAVLMAPTASEARADATYSFGGEVAASDASCGPDHTFSIESGARALDGFAAATVPTNDVVLELLKDGVLLVVHAAPERFHYEPPGGVPAGIYVVSVCDFPGGAGWAEPRTYTGTLTLVFNSAPTADAGGPYSVAEGGSVGVTAAGSDPDGGTLSYAWDLDNDGEFDDASGQTASFSAAAIDGPATRTIRVRVSDASSSTIDEATVSVTNVAPTATFNAPASALAGSAFTLSLTNARDAAPADGPGLQYAFDCGSGYSAFSASNTTSCPTDSTGTRSVGGKVRDDDGGVTEYRATVTVTVTYASLCALVQQYVDKEGVANALCSTLDAAARKADRKGQEADLHAFVNQVEAQSGKSMTAQEAAILTALAQAL